MHKTHIFDQKIMQKLFFYRPTYPNFFSDRYRKQTISFFSPKRLKHQPVPARGLLVQPRAILISKLDNLIIFAFFKLYLLPIWSLSSKKDKFNNAIIDYSIMLLYTQNISYLGDIFKAILDIF